MDGSSTWFNCYRSAEAMELVSAYPNAFRLLFVIAFRARRTDAFNAHGLKPGQAFIGDAEKCGFTEKEYRTAKAQLQKFGFAAFKGTNKGTVATLLDSRVFDISMPTKGEQKGEQGASEGRTKGKQGATNNLVNPGNPEKHVNLIPDAGAPEVKINGFKKQHLPENSEITALKEGFGQVYRAITGNVYVPTRYDWDAAKNLLLHSPASKVLDVAEKCLQARSRAKEGSFSTFKLVGNLSDLNKYWAKVIVALGDGRGVHTSASPHGPGAWPDETKVAEEQEASY